MAFYQPKVTTICGKPVLAWEDDEDLGLSVLIRKIADNDLSAEPQRAFSVKRSIIYYPDETIVQVMDLNIDKQLEQVFMKNSLLDIEADYFIAFIWVDSGDLMIDLWTIVNQPENRSGSLIDSVRVFRNGKLDIESGVGSRDTVEVVTSELKHLSGKSLREYLGGERPKLPKRLALI